ncbi:ribonuclease H-like domain-containing protein [uncultured Methanomethylovorans sp.]|uniref:ribonuclease H-like domain-containing protein n=1 Tax=uncultured Methanomethylovorans sp. TaxID=183759 RepID=UPI002AA93AA0|nr:ribonuclease H-like domain-containing protein [uncultured Methanomethylovorans sp.]
MLESTYIHIPMIGATIEKRIWTSGVRTWKDFLRERDSISIPDKKKSLICAGIVDSIDRLEAKDHEFFSRSLPSSEHWRAYRHFSDKVACVDIETTGLAPGHDSITVVGIYDGKEARTYVKGIDLEEIVEELPKYTTLITFNGARFDIPFIKREFPDIEFDQLHIDLMYPLRRIGLAGGLKKVEKMVGISRSEDTTGLSGFDAVRLWREYERGNKRSLDLLLEYNREDIVNLKTIIDMVYDRLVENKYSQCQI